MAFLYFALTAFLASFPVGQTQKLTIELNGLKVGESVWTLNTDGSFVATSTFERSSQKYVAKISGKKVDGVVTDVNAIATSPKKTVEYSYQTGTFKSVTTEEKREIKYDLAKNKAVVVGNLIPQMYSEALGQVHFENKAPQIVHLYIADLGWERPAEFTARGVKTMKLGEARFYRVIINSVLWEIATDAKGMVVGAEVPVQKFRWLLDGWESVFDSTN